MIYTVDHPNHESDRSVCGVPGALWADRAWTLCLSRALTNKRAPKRMATRTSLIWKGDIKELYEYDFKSCDESNG